MGRESPDGWAHDPDNPDPDNAMPAGPFAITSMPVSSRPPIKPPGKLARTVAAPTAKDDE